MASAAAAAGGGCGCGNTIAAEAAGQRLFLLSQSSIPKSILRPTVITSSSMGRRRRRRLVRVTNSSSNNNSSNKPSLSSKSPYEILGVEPSCSLAHLKAAFRARVKEFHPDVCQDLENSDAMIRRIIQAYELLSKYHNSEVSVRGDSDPFEEPECEAYDIFVNEILCIGKGCPYSCVKKAPHAFSFSPEIGTARVFSQGHGDDYQVQLAVGQCPRRCIHYVTPAQRAILEELLYSIVDAPYDSAETALLDSLIMKASYENNRYQKPKPKPKVSSEIVDWY